MRNSTDDRLLTAATTLEMEKPGHGIAIPSCSIEGLQVLHEVNVQPFQSTFARGLCGLSEKTQPDSLASNVRMYCRVQHEPMDPTIPSDVDEAHQPRALEGRDVDEAALKYGVEVSLLMGGWPRGLEESVEFPVGEGRLLTVADLVHLSGILLMFVRAVNHSSYPCAIAVATGNAPGVQV